MANPAIAIEKAEAERWHEGTERAISFAGGNASSWSDFGQMAFHLECAACDWTLSSCTIVEAKAQAAGHYKQNPGHPEESVSIRGRVEFEVCKI